MIAIQLWRWFLFHVGIGFIPIGAAVLFPILFGIPPHMGEPRAAEVLFLAFMLSSLTFADIVEVVADHGLNNLRLLLLSFLLVGVGLCLLLYGAISVDPRISMNANGDQSVMLWISGGMVALFFAVGTLVQWLFWKAKKETGSVAGTDDWKLI